MKIIKLTKGKETIVDNEDFNYLNQWKWHITSGGYAYRREYLGGGQRDFNNIYIHRLLLKNPIGFQTDHINGNRLDNRKENLRIVTASQNQMNKGIRSDNSTGYSGVWFDKSRNKWVAELWFEHKKVFSKRFSELDDAILARKIVEELYFQQYRRKR